MPLIGWSCRQTASICTALTLTATPGKPATRWFLLGWGVWMSLLANTAVASIGAEGRYLIAAYGSRNSPDRLMDILFRPPPEFRDSYASTVALSYVFADAQRARVEWETNITKHYGMQYHWEANTLAIARWMSFPWDDWVDSRVALGSGLSYAFEIPYLEPRTTLGRGESTQLLHFMVVEKEFAVPDHPQWSAFVRIHHRSGMFGLFSGVRGGSNFLGIGVRYRLDMK